MIAAVIWMVQDMGFAEAQLGVVMSSIYGMDIPDLVFLFKRLLLF